MDSGSVVVGAILVVLCMLPIIFISIGRKKSQKQMLNAIKIVALQHNGDIKKQQLFRDFAVALDTVNRLAFYTRTINGKTEEVFVNLSEVKECTLRNINRTVQVESEVHKVIDRVELVFSHKESNLLDKKFTFYNAEYSLQLNGELQSAEKWLVDFKNALN